MLAKRSSSAFADALSSRFSDMHKAFKSIDLDGSGKICSAEIGRACRLWNLPHSQKEIDALVAICDTDADGGVSYKEFVAALARDTVQREEASWERKDTRASRPEEADAARGIFGKIESKRYGEAPKIINAQQGLRGKSGNVLDAAQTALNTRFGNMRRAFRFMDVDNSGTVTREEVERALKLWNVPVDNEEVNSLVQMCDHDGDGRISYAELVAALARDKYVGA